MKSAFAPIEITLYDENDEKVKTLTKSVVRWGIMKKALKLAKFFESEGNTNSISEDSFDQLTAFVCTLFDDKVTVEELENGADISEMMTTFRQVMQRASSLGNA